MASSLLLRFPGTVQTHSCETLDQRNQGVCENAGSTASVVLKAFSLLACDTGPPLLRQMNRPPGPSPESPRLPPLLNWVRNT